MTPERLQAEKNLGMPSRILHTSNGKRSFRSCCFYHLYNHQKVP